MIEDPWLELGKGQLAVYLTHFYRLFNAFVPIWPKQALSPLPNYN